MSSGHASARPAAGSSLRTSERRQAVMARIRAAGLVPVVRAPDAATAEGLSALLADAGLSVVEVTMTVPGAPDVIRALRLTRPELLVGAGTVLDADAAAACLDAGAAFIVSPALDRESVELCRDRDVPICPGALTPTEVIAAWKAGADVVKIFPANAVGGASYLKSLRAALPQVALLPTGGVSLETAAGFLAAGAIALGIGADLVDVAAFTQGRAEQIRERARAYLALVAAARRG